MDLKNKIRVALGLEPIEASEEKIEFAVQETLTDGTVIVSEAEQLEPGAKVDVLGEDGVLMPLPAGKYETESGIGFSVEEEGFVAEIYDDEEVEEEVAEEEVEAEEIAPIEASEDTIEEEVAEVIEDKKYSWGEKLKEEIAQENIASKEEILGAVSDMLKQYKDDLLKEIAELSGTNETLNTEIENKDNEIAELKKQPAVENLNTNKFSSNKVEFNEVSRSTYNKMSQSEKFLYNLNKSK
tara:strand:- start:1085 stop:1804 length:720 start_codon:yes stop_codon:yes gene_type:complete